MFGNSTRKTKLCRKCRCEIDKKASKCPHCGSSQTSGCVTILAVLIIVFVVLTLPNLGNSYNSQHSGSSSSSTTTQKKRFEFGEAKGSINSITGFCTVTGTVKNVSGKDYSYAQITIAFYDASGAKLETGIDAY